MKEIYQFNGKFYELVKRRASGYHTFYILDDNLQRLPYREMTTGHVRPGHYEIAVSFKIATEGIILANKCA